jgi:uncharacterized protein (DUF488 family)
MGCNVTTIFTIGHSSRSTVEFVALLQQVAVDLLVDVRAIHRSGTNPQFNSDILPRTLVGAGISYLRLSALGGPRHPAAGDSQTRNPFWHNTLFACYADYVETAAFRRGLDELRTVALDHCCAIMCAEAVWWRCHRRIISDYLLAEGISVAHIIDRNRIDLATLTPGARVLAPGKVLYPGMNENV